MTELEFAIEFVKVYAARALQTAASGQPLDDASEFRQFCKAKSVSPSDERRDLARDVVLVIRELCSSEGPIEIVGPETYVSVAPRALFDSLEQHGWRRAYLSRTVRS